MFYVGSVVVRDYGYTHVRSPHPSCAFRLACLIVGLLMGLGLTFGSFKLGILVENRGSGTARSVKIQSGLPRIVENLAGLAIDFDMLDSSFGSSSGGTFTVDFGDIAPGDTRVGYWILRTSLAGTFLSFTSEMTHELVKGTEVHPLIAGISSEIIEAEDMAPLEDDPADFYTLVDRDADGFPDYLISLVSGVKIEFRLADQVSVTHPYTADQPFLGFDVPVTPGLFLAILTDPAPGEPNMTGLTQGARTLSIRNYFRKDGRLFVLDRDGGSYAVSFGSGLTITDAYYTVADQPRSYPYLPDAGGFICLMARVENLGSVAEAGFLELYCNGVFVSRISTGILSPYAYFENDWGTLYYFFPREGYLIDNTFELRVGDSTQLLPVTLNIPPEGAILLPEDPTVLVPALFKAIDLADPDGQVITCYWSFGDSPDYELFDAFHFQASGLEVTHTYESSGTYTVKMLVKDSNQSMSLVERQLTVGETRPDIVVSSITTTPETLTEPWDPSPVTFYVTLSNNGLSATTGSFLVGLYLDGVYLGSLSCSEVLEPGQSATLEGFTLTLDSLNHAFVARADDNDLVDEADEGNNSRSALLTVDCPDLAITELSYTLPQGRITLSWGETVTLSARVANLSNATGLTFFVLFFLDGNAVASRQVEGLGQGEETLVSADWLASAGTHTLRVIVDADLGRIVEENEENNSRELTLPELTVLLADIEILNVSASPSSGSMASGSPINLQALIRNAGEGSALAPFNLSFYVDGSYVGSRSVEALVSGAASLVALAWAAEAGNHTLTLRVDEEGSLPEASESNNSAETSFGPLSLLYSDLLITSFTLTPETAAAGDTLLARVTVCNAGDAATLSGFDVLITLDGQAVALTRSAGSLTAGSSATLEAAFRIECPEGPHTVTASLDSAGLIAEKSETNNTATTTLATTGAFTPEPAEAFTLSLQSAQASYSYGETIDLHGDATSASGPLSSALVTLSFTSGSASITRYVATDENGHWTLSIPAVELAERLYLEGAAGTIEQITLSASATLNGTTVTSNGTISIGGPEPASPVLALSPDSLLFGLRPGDFRCVELTICNIGNASLKLSAIKGMALLPWMSVAVPAKLDLAPGEKITVNLYLAPPSDMVLPHAFSGQLKVEGTYGTEEEQQTIVRELPFTVELSNPDLATLDFSITGIGAGALAQAFVTILHLESYASYQRATSGQGHSTFADMPTGEYLWFVTSAGYENAIGKIETGNLQAGIEVDVLMTPSGLSIPSMIAPSFTMTPSADHCYEREPILVTMNLGSGISNMTDVASYLRVLDSAGADVTNRFQLVPLSLMAGTIPENVSSSSKFLLIPLSNTADDYTLKAIANVSIEGIRKTMEFMSGLEVRGPPELSITYFIPSTVEIGKSYRAGFELANHGSAVEGLRMDYFFLGLSSANWRTPASYVAGSATVALTEWGLTAGLGTLGGEEALRGYVTICSASVCLTGTPAASMSILSSLGTPLNLRVTTSSVKYLFHDGVVLEAPREQEDASLVSPAAAALPTQIFSWSTGELTAMTAMNPESAHRPTFVESYLTLIIPDESQGYVLSCFPDEWQGYEITGVAGGSGEAVHSNNYWRGAGSGFVLYCHNGPLTITFAQDWEIRAFCGPGFYMGNPQVVSLPYAWEVVTWQEERLVDYEFGQYVCDFWWGGWTFGEEGLNWEALRAQGERSTHVMCALVQTGANTDSEKMVTWFGFLADYDSYKSGSQAGRYNDTVSPAIAAGDDGTFLIVCEGYDDSRPSGKKKYLYMFLCDPAKGEHCNTGGEYRDRDWNLVSEFDEVEGYDPKSPAVAWDPIRKAYHVVYLARNNAEDFDYEVYRCGVRVQRAWESLDPHCEEIIVRMVGDVFYQEGPEGGEDGSCSSPFIAVCDHIETSLSSKQKALPHVMWVWEEISQQGDHVIKMRAENYDLEPIRRRLPEDEGGGAEEDPSVYYLAAGGTNPRIAASMWDTALVTWTSPDGQGSRAIKGRVFKTSTLFVEEFLKDEPEADCAGAFTIVDSGCGWQTELVSYRNGYFALVYCKNDDIFWKLYDYEGNACLSGYSEKVNHSNNEGQRHVANRAPSIADLPWYKNLVSVWTCEDNGEYRIVLTVVAESETFNPVPDWYAGDGHVHSARPEDTTWDIGPGNYYYSWMEKVFGAVTISYQGRYPNCREPARSFHGIAIPFPNPPSPKEQASGASYVGLGWIILTEHGPMLGMSTSTNNPESAVDDDMVAIAWDYIEEDAESAWRHEYDHDVSGLAGEGILVVLGEEMGSAPPVNGDGHLLCYGLLRYINGGVDVPVKDCADVEHIATSEVWTWLEDHSLAYGCYEYYSVDNLRILAENAAAFGYIAHPSNPENGNKWGAWDIFASDLYKEKGIVGLEILTDKNLGIDLNLEAWDRLLAMGCEVYGIGNNDGNWSYKDMVLSDIGIVGNNRTFVYCPQGITDQNLLSALQYGWSVFSSGIDMICCDPVNTIYHSSAGDTVVISSTAPLRELKVVYDVESNGEGEAYRYFYNQDDLGDHAGELPYFVVREANGVYRYICNVGALSGSNGIRKGYYRFEGLTTTGTLVYTQPIFADSRAMTYEVSGTGMGFRSSAAEYSELFAITEASNLHQLTGFEIHATDFLGSAGDLIPSSSISFDTSIALLGPGQSTPLTVTVHVPIGTPEGRYYGTIQVMAAEADTGRNVYLPINMTILVDWTAPEVPLLDALAHIDVYAMPMIVTGMCEPVTYYEILSDGQVIAMGYSDELGRIYSAVDVQPGEHQITARARDSAMNYSPLSDAILARCHTSDMQPGILRLVTGENATLYLEDGTCLREVLVYNAGLTGSLSGLSFVLSEITDSVGNTVATINGTVEGAIGSLGAGEARSLLIRFTIPQEVDEGSYSCILSCQAELGAGPQPPMLTGTTAITIDVDRTPPEPAVLLQTVPQDVLTRPLIIRGTAEFDCYYEILVDGVPVAHGFTDSSGNIESPITLAIGEHVITARVRDSHNWSTESNPVTVYCDIDATAPASLHFCIGDALDNADWYSSDVELDISSTDEEGGSGLALIEYSLDQGETWSQYCQRLVIAGEGMHQIWYRATDVAANVEGIKVARVGIDIHEPEASVEYPQTGSIVDELLILSGSVSDANLLRYDVYIRPQSVLGRECRWIRYAGQYVAQAVEGELCCIDLAAVPYGDYELRLVVRDKGGRKAEDYISFSVCHGPVIQEIAPQSGFCGDEIMVLGYHFGDDRGDSHVAFGDMIATEYLVWSDTEIRVIVPVCWAGVVPLVAATAAGSSEPVNFLVRDCTILSVPEQIVVEYSDLLAVTVRLTDSRGIALPNRQIQCLAAGQLMTALTDSNGLAIITVYAEMSPGEYEVLVYFEGDFMYEASIAGVLLSVMAETLEVNYSGDERVRATDSIWLSASLRELDGSKGDLALVGQVTFEIRDSSGVLVREVDAPITQTSPGVGIVSTETAPLPVGIYTVSVRLGSTYYSKNQVCSVELFVYDPTTGRVQGSGISLSGGLQTFSFNIKFKNGRAGEPSGHLILVDLSWGYPPIMITVTGFTVIVIPEGQGHATVLGTCSINGTGGFSFRLEVEDEDSRLVNSGDTLSLWVWDSCNALVYEKAFRVMIGEIKVRA